MRRYVLLLVAAVALVSASEGATRSPASVNRNMITSYDEFTGKTSVALKAQRVPGTGLTMSALFQYPGTSAVLPDTTALVFFNYAQQWGYLRFHTFEYIVDGQPGRVPTTHQGDVDGHAWVHEQMIALVPTSVVIAILSGEARCRLGTTEFVLADEKKSTPFRDFASMMRAMKLPAATGGE